MSNDHTVSGTYRAEKLIPEAVQDLTLEQILTLVVSRIVSRPDEVEVNVVSTQKIKVIEFDVAPEDRGPILGKNGYTIQALRTISKAILGARVKDFSYRIDLTHDDVAKR